jgi:carbon monoxide dehydrogenase subunit G
MMTDPNQVARCLPDLQKLDVRSPDEFEAVVKAGMAFIRGVFDVLFRIVEKIPPTEVKLKAHGTGLGSAVDMEILAEMSPRSGGGTSMKWKVDALISGKIASLGQRLIQAQAQKLIERLFACLRGRLESS